MGSRSTWGINAVIDPSDAEPAKRVFRVASEEGNNQAFSNKVEKGLISLREKKGMPKSGRCGDKALRAFLVIGRAIPFHMVFDGKRSDSLSQLFCLILCCAMKG